MRVLDAARQIAKHGVKGEYAAFQEYVRQRMREATPEEKELWSEVLELYERQNGRCSNHQDRAKQENAKAKNQQLTPNY